MLHHERPGWSRRPWKSSGLLGERYIQEDIGSTTDQIIGLTQNDAVAVGVFEIGPSDYLADEMFDLLTCIFVVANV